MKPIYEPKGKAKEYGDLAINIYTGCPHNCFYCVSGDTLLLMADGSSKKIKDINIGDKVYGTISSNGYRKYAITEVLNKFSSVKPAVKIVLNDGTTIISSEDHRFFTDRGWKHAIGSMSGKNRRPYLTTNNKIFGGGKEISNETPPETDEYRWGYLSGAIKGDGTVGHYFYDKCRVHSLRVAVKDSEIIQRVSQYLKYFGFAAFEFSHNCGKNSYLYAVRNSRKLEVEAINKGIQLRRNKEFMRGFLAGIYDTEGCAGEAKRIGNSSKEILDFTMASLAKFGFTYVYEKNISGNNKNVSAVRIKGGLLENIRFLQTVDCACKRKFLIEGRTIKTPADLKVKSIEKLGRKIEMFDITTGTGDFIANGVIAHNCFSPKVLHTDKETFHTHVEPRKDIVEEVRKQIEREGIKDKLIHLCFTCDPYPTGYDTTPTREIIKIIKETGNHVQILTKGDGTRDFDLLDENDWYGITVDGGKMFNKTNIADLNKAHEHGIKTWISFEPVLNEHEVIFCLEYVGLSGVADKVKIGKLNYFPSDINWKEFGEKAEEICKTYNIDYYIKESLREEMEKKGESDL